MEEADRVEIIEHAETMIRQDQYILLQTICDLHDFKNNENADITHPLVQKVLERADWNYAARSTLVTLLRNLNTRN